MYSISTQKSHKIGILYFIRIPQHRVSYKVDTLDTDCTSLSHEIKPISRYNRGLVIIYWKTTQNPKLLYLHLYLCTCHQSIIVLCICFQWILILLNLKCPFIHFSIEKMKLLEQKLILILVIITWRWVGASIITVLS